MSLRSIFKTVRSGLLREDHICPWWLAYTFDNPLRRFLHNPEIMLANQVKEGMTVADIGCGMGYFSVAMAKMVGRTGKVIAADIQQEMLDILKKRAEKRGAAENLRFVLASRDDIGIREPLDFVLAFWMVHETGNIPGFFRQVSSVLKQEGAMLIAEPRLHVSSRKFQETLQHARDAGFEVREGPKVRISRSALLVKK
jgi:ubiquinone/menaquinone biosynthesis C-methylase UbiE